MDCNNICSECSLNGNCPIIGNLDEQVDVFECEGFTQPIISITGAILPILWDD
jgi:hypothetical protein